MKDRSRKLFFISLAILICLVFALWGWLKWGGMGEEDMVLIPGGNFIMGEEGGSLMRYAEDPTGDRVNMRDERSRHAEKVGSFYIDRYEVTNAQYADFVLATRARTPGSWEGKPTYPPEEADYPVTGINFGEAEAYCKWRGKRLPTEEEWEKAARGAVEYLYPWGRGYQKERANTWEEGTRGPRSIHDFRRDKGPYGVYGMAGNVSEWTSTIVQLGEHNVRAVVKGGSWTVDGREWNLTFQLLSPPYGYMNHVGFRCAKSASSSRAEVGEAQSK